MQLANNLDTITAIATPSGAGGIGVGRVFSGQFSVALPLGKRCEHTPKIVLLENFPC